MIKNEFACVRYRSLLGYTLSKVYERKADTEDQPRKSETYKSSAEMEEKPRILIVDDERINIDILHNLLKSDYRLLIAKNGEQALKRAHSETPPDLILLDVVMKGMDGYEVCRRLKEDKNTCNIPIIFVTSMNEARDHTQGFEMGAVDYIKKPFEPMEVKVRVKTQLKLRQAKLDLEKNNQQLEDISSKLSKYISAPILDSIFSGKHEVELRTSRKRLTIFFSDIKDFTHITDSIAPELLSSLLNDYFNEMSKIVNQYGGTLDKFIGDAILVFFGDPESRGVSEDAVACVEMAVAMQRKLVSLRQRWEEQGIARLFHVRMGISSGFCNVGNFGSEDRLEYTIIGNEVNLASRLETCANAGEILVSQETYLLIKDDILCEAKEKVAVKGLALPVQSYVVFGIKKELGQGVHSIKAQREGFSLYIDIPALSEEAQRAVLQKLQSSVKVLETRLYRERTPE